MRSKILVIGLLAGLIATPAMADGTASKKETIGIGVGGVIGAVAGGPVGFIVGAAFGAKIGDEFHEKDTEVISLSDSLAGSKEKISELETSVDALNSDIDSLGGDLQRMRAVARPELLTLMQAGIAMDLLFRTDEHVLGVNTDTRLRELAASLATMPDVFVQLDGFADERGDAQYNQKLSVLRAEHVRDILISNGVQESRIKLAAHGESPAADDNIDSFALERKVSLTLFVEESPSFASNPD
jgi:outer membrane protein OmpA-like peptidoglycan-associated protein